MCYLVIKKINTTYRKIINNSISIFNELNIDRNDLIYYLYTFKYNDWYYSQPCDKKLIIKIRNRMNRNIINNEFFTIKGKDLNNIFKTNKFNDNEYIVDITE